MGLLAVTTVAAAGLHTVQWKTRIFAGHTFSISKLWSQAVMLVKFKFKWFSGPLKVSLSRSRGHWS